MPTIKLTKSTINGLATPSKTTTHFDTELKGFGLRLSPSGARRWIVEYRPGEGGRGVAKKRMVIGGGHIAPDEARKAASAILSKVRLGEDPQQEKQNLRDAGTVEDLLASYIERHVRPHSKAGTFALSKIYCDKHIIPAIGRRNAISLQQSDVAKLHRKIGDSAAPTANRVIALLHAAYAYHIDRKLLPKTIENPAAGIKKFKEVSRERYLSLAEFQKLGEALREAETIGISWRPQDTTSPDSKHAPKTDEARRTVIGPHAAGAVRLIIFTGARLREILHLQWQHVDLERGLLLLPDSKSGKKTIVLNEVAAAILDGLPRIGKYVIAGDAPDRPRSDLKRPWALLQRRAGLEDVRLHDMRHCYASVGVGASLGLPIVGKLLGHKNYRTTERYAHLAVDPLRQAANAIGHEIAGAMGEATK